MHRLNVLFFLFLILTTGCRVYAESISEAPPPLDPESDAFYQNIRPEDFTGAVHLRGMNKITARIAPILVEKDHTASFGNFRLSGTKGAGSSPFGTHVQAHVRMCPIDRCSYDCQ